MQSASDLILRNGPLSPVWLASTMKDKVGRKVVLAADISSLAEQIAQEDRVSLVLRLSGMLLKGVVVLYSKKTQYMLGDCEDVIHKIKLSYNTGSIDLPEGSGKFTALMSNNARGEAVTLQPVANLEEWIRAQNPEDTFELRTLPLQFSQQSTAASFSESEMSSSESSQLPISTQDFPMPAHTPEDGAPNPVATFNEPDLDDGGFGFPDGGDDWEMDTDDRRNDRPALSSSESEAEPAEKKDDTHILDGKHIVLSQRDRRKRKARQLAGAPRAHVRGDDELDDLFESVMEKRRREEAERRETETNAHAYDDYGIGGGFADYEVDDVALPAPQQVAEEIASDSDTEGAMRRPSLSDGENIFMRPEHNLMSGDAPVLVQLGDNDMFPLLVQPTPLRGIKDSVSIATKRALDKYRQELPEENSSVSFQEMMRGKSRHDVAANFYQMLVLKSTSRIDIAQNESFGDILISPGPMFNQ